MSLVFIRYIFHPMPPSHLAPTLWVGIAPTSILTILALKFAKPLALFFQATPEIEQILTFSLETSWSHAVGICLVLVFAGSGDHFRRSPKIIPAFCAQLVGICISRWCIHSFDRRAFSDDPAGVFPVDRINSADISLNPLAGCCSKYNDRRLAWQYFCASHTRKTLI